MTVSYTHLNLLVSCKATDEVLKLIDVEYVMDSALYGISFDRILQQLSLIHIFE